jgi:hypothetical protein
MEAHETRAKTLSGLKAKFHTARPWQKKSDNNAENLFENNFENISSTRNVAESSEEEMEQVYKKASTILIVSLVTVRLPCLIVDSS